MVDKTVKPLRTEDAVEAILAVSEGPIEGLEFKNDFMVGDTPLFDSGGKPNFPKSDNEEESTLKLKVIHGESSGESLVPKLGGAGSTTSVDPQLKLVEGNPIERAVTDPNFTDVELRFVIQRLFKTDDEGDKKANNIDLDIAYKTDSDPNWRPFIENARVVRIEGKAEFEFIKEFRRKIFHGGSSETVTISVTKLEESGNDGARQSFADITWETIQTVKAGAEFGNQNVAMFRLLGRPEGQFSSLPQMNGIWKGKLVKVPDIYDPKTRTYNDPWDGTFANDKKWTDNPVWILWDLIHDTTAGMAAQLPNINANRFDFLEASKWCDEQVPTPDGTDTEPRYTFNGVIQEARDGRDMMRFIAGLFNGVPFDMNNGTIGLEFDRKDQQPVALFSPENVKGGIFEYSYTDISTRHNDVTVTFVNPNLNWQQDTRNIRFPEHQSQFGRIPLEFEAVGCIKPGEAIRRAKYRMVTALTETEQVSFTTNRQGLFVNVFDVILIADPDMEHGLSGRVYSTNGDIVETTSPIFLEAGVDYKFSMKIVGQDELFETDVLNSSGETTTLQLADSLPSEGVPSRQVFGLHEGNATPKPYRIVKIDEGENADEVSLNCVEINRDKWQFADDPDDGEVQVPNDKQGEVIQGPNRTDVFPSKPQNIEATTDITTTPQETTTSIIVNWDRPRLNPFFDKYKVEHFIGEDDEPAQEVTTSTKSFRLNNVQEGFHKIKVSAISIEPGAEKNRSSSPAVISLVIGDEAPLENVSVNGLEVEGRGASNTFTSRSPTFSWRATADMGSGAQEFGSESRGADSGFMEQTFRDFQIEIKEPEQGEIVHTDHTTSLSWTFDFDVNANLDGGPYRNFIISVRVRDKYNRLSEAEELEVENEAPAPPTVTVISKPNGFVVQTPEPSDSLDFSGMAVWMGLESTFNTNPGNLVYKGPDTTSPEITVPDNRPRWIKTAWFDNFGIQDIRVPVAKKVNLDRPVTSFGITAEKTPVGAEIRWNQFPDPRWSTTEVYVDKIPEGSGEDPVFEDIQDETPIAITRSQEYHLIFKQTRSSKIYKEFVNSTTDELTDDQFIDRIGEWSGGISTEQRNELNNKLSSESRAEVERYWLNQKIVNPTQFVNKLEFWFSVDHEAQSGLFTLTDEEKETWVTDAAGQNSDWSQLRFRFATEFSKAKGLTDRLFIFAIYNLYLERDPTDTELNNWLDKGASEGDRFRVWLRPLAPDGQPGAASAPIDITVGKISQDDLDQSLIDLLNSLEGSAAVGDGDITTFFQDFEPSDSESSLGDFWFDTDNNDKAHRYKDTTGNGLGDTWQETDSPVAEAIKNSASAEAKADGKVTTFFQDNAPTSPNLGDLWVDTTDGSDLIFRWTDTNNDGDGDTWERIQGPLGNKDIIDTGELSPQSVTKIFTQDKSGSPLATGDDTFQTLTSVSFSLNVSGSIYIDAYINQQYSTFSIAHKLHINVDGNLKQANGGIATEDYPNISWAGSVSSGTHTIDIIWKGETSDLQVGDLNLFVVGLKR